MIYTFLLVHVCVCVWVFGSLCPPIVWLSGNMTNMSLHSGLTSSVLVCFIFCLNMIFVFSNKFPKPYYVA